MLPVSVITCEAVAPYLAIPSIVIELPLLALHSDSIFKFIFEAEDVLRLMFSPALVTALRSARIQ
jgi:hypothetical protein